jgi:hypothetical protein
MISEPDWGQPVRISARLAEDIAEALGKLGHATTAEQVRAEMGRPSAARSGTGMVITTALESSWAQGDLTRSDLHIGLAAEAEELRLRQNMAETGRLFGEIRQRSDRLRELASGGTPADQDETLRLMDENGALLEQVMRLQEDPPPGQ